MKGQGRQILITRRPTRGGGFVWSVRYVHGRNRVAVDVATREGAEQLLAIIQERLVVEVRRG